MNILPQLAKEQRQNDGICAENTARLQSQLVKYYMTCQPWTLGVYSGRKGWR